MAETNPVYPVSSTRVIDDPAEMTGVEPHASSDKKAPFRTWLLTTLLLALIISAAFVGLNVKLDLLGLHGRNDVRVETLQRFSVYLMSYRFIPNHFDGLLLGNSQGAAYDTSTIHKYRIFNAAMRGASMTEERIVAEEVLKRGHLNCVIIILNPTMTAPHSEKSAYMTPHDYWSSYGSLQTLMIDYPTLRDRLGHHVLITYNDYGRTLFPVRMDPGNFETFTAEQLSFDPAEVNDLVSLLAELHAKHTKVFFLFGPMYQPQFDAQKDNLLAWRSKVASFFAPQDTFIRLPPDVERSLQAKRENFPDYAHMTAPATAVVMKVVAQSVDGE